MAGTDDTGTEGTEGKPEELTDAEVSRIADRVNAPWGTFFPDEEEQA